ncbi:uncharacterized protein LOC142347901 isoform X2 [Convolutriloba macropyga]|uniref:uncharacterized protein LOC142347901 isoform X2 n=1 Tax=Convolutriloba macropyga TaxID=536237 RepID=UPI003F5276C0
MRKEKTVSHISSIWERALKKWDDFVSSLDKPSHEIPPPICGAAVDQNTLSTDSCEIRQIATQEECDGDGDSGIQDQIQKGSLWDAASQVSAMMASATPHSENADGQITLSADDQSSHLNNGYTSDNRASNNTVEDRSRNTVLSAKKKRAQFFAVRNFIRLLDVEAFLNKLQKFNYATTEIDTVDSNVENVGPQQFEFSQESPQKRSNKFMLHELRSQPQCIQQRIKLPHMNEDELNATKLSGNHRITDIARYGEKLREKQHNSRTKHIPSFLERTNFRASGKNKSKKQSDAKNKKQKDDKTKKQNDAKTKKRFAIWRMK